MKCLSGLLIVAVAGAAVSTAWAGPDPQRTPSKKPPFSKVRQLPTNPGSADGPGFSDNFDSYTANSTLVGQGGWQFWGPGAFDATVDNATAASAPNSIVSTIETDVVQVFDHGSGQWVCKAKTYYPSTSTGAGFFIMLNTFSLPFTTGNWSIEVHFNDAAYGLGMVTSLNRSVPNGGPGNTQVPIIFDQWVEIVVEIDLNADTFTMTYGGLPLVTTNGQWSWNASGAVGQPRIQCIDLYSQSAGFRWDDVSLEPAGPSCYANCDESTDPPILNVADFGCFLQKYAANDPYANCDESTDPPVLNVADFGCFLQKYAAGCP